MQKFPYQLTIAEIFKRYTTSAQGLSEAEARKRLLQHGKNILPQQKKFTHWKLLLSQFNNILMAILTVGAIVSFFVGDRIDALVMAITIFINVVIGYSQEYKAEHALAKLQEVISPQAIVVRGGVEKSIAASELLPGDVILLKAGMKIPADARLIEADSLQCNEANLTGESLPVDKATTPLRAVALVPGQTNMVFSGTLVASGLGRAVVCMTGKDTQLGAIALLLQKAPSQPTPLQKRLLRMSRLLGVAIVAVIAVLFGLGLALGRPFTELFFISISLVVAAIPEGLVLAVTVILALGMQRILKRRGLVRHLISAETLGSTNVICTDKTGTLTVGEMKVTQVVTIDAQYDFLQLPPSPLPPNLLNALEIGFMNNEVSIENPFAVPKSWQVLGSPTEQALFWAGVGVGLKDHISLRREIELDVMPFSSERKFRASLHHNGNGHNVVYATGAPERIFAMCSRVLSRSGTRRLVAGDMARLQKIQEDFSKRGLRVVAVAEKVVPSHVKELVGGGGSPILTELTFVALLVLSDVLRPEVKDTISKAQKAGITVVMVTGDNKFTALSIARELGITANNDNICVGEELERMSDRELLARVKKISVYARVSPQHKYRIVQAWKQKGAVVAMTGDGVNDAPALEAADIGVCVGSAADVSKETSDLVLLDNNFTTIVSAIEEGRSIFQNIKKVIFYLLSDSFSEIILVGGSVLVGLPLPVTPSQILWVNLVEDSLPAFALAFEPSDPASMQEKPRPLSAPLLEKRLQVMMVVSGLVNNAILFFLYFLFLRTTGDLALTKTVVFVSLSMNSLLFALSCRSLKTPLSFKGLFTNPWLLAALAFGVAVVVAAVSVPALQKLLHTVPLSWNTWVLIVCLALVRLPAVEIMKWWYNKR